MHRLYVNLRVKTQLCSSLPEFPVRHTSCMDPVRHTSLWICLLYACNAISLGLSERLNKNLRNIQSDYFKNKKKIGQRWLKMFEKLILIFPSACVHSIGYVHLRSQKTLVQWQHFILMIHQQLRHRDRVNSNTCKPHTTRFLSLNNLQSLHKTHNEKDF